MPTARDRYPDRWSLRSAVRVTEAGLVEEFHGLGQRLTPWSDLREVRWTGAGTAELLLVSGATLGLPRGLPDLEALVARIEQEAREVQQTWRDEGVPPEQIAAWLGIRPGRRLRHDPNPMVALAGLAVLGFSLAVLGLGLTVEQPQPDDGDLETIFGALVGAALGVGMIASGLRKASEIYRADAEGLSCRGGDNPWSFRWRDLHTVRQVVLGDRTQTSEAVFQTHDRVYRIRVGSQAIARMVAAGEHIAAANAAYLTRAGSAPVPDSALSPARLTSPEGDRGLSRTETD